MNNESSVRSNSNEYNQGTKQNQQIHEIHNASTNRRYLMDENNDLLPHVKDLSDAERHDGEAAFIIGSGPSLDAVIPKLRDWKGGIFCTTSHAVTLMHLGVEPTHIVALDPFCQWSELKGVDWSKTKTVLVMQPGIWPDLVKNWPGEIVLFMQDIGQNGTFYRDVERFMFCKRDGFRNESVFHTLIKSSVMQFACSPPCQLLIAGGLGYGNIFLAGCDFGFPGGKSRFTTWRIDEETNDWKEEEYKYIPTDSDILSNNGIPTQPVHLYYKKNFMSAWRLGCQKIWSLDKGIMPEVPAANIDEVIKHQGLNMPGGYDHGKIAKVTEKYLATVGAFIVVKEDGNLLFIETGNPAVDLPVYMDRILKQWKCDKCPVTGTSNDDVDHTGDKCVQCDGTMVRAFPIDLDKNMERLTKLIKHAKEFKSREEVTNQRAEEIYAEYQREYAGRTDEEKETAAIAAGSDRHAEMGDSITIE